MNAVPPDRPLALVLARLGGQARARLIEALQPQQREKVLASLDSIDQVDRAEMSAVEQSLSQELDGILGDRDVEADPFRQYYPLRVADLLTLVLLKGTGERASIILPHLPHSVQAECIHAIAGQDWEALENHLGAEERDLVLDFDAWLGKPFRRPRPDLAVTILRGITAPRQLRALLTAIYHRDAEVAKAIQAALFSIEDLRRVTDRELQQLTTGIDDWDLAIAFLGMSEGLQRRILANVSERRAAHLSDDVEHLQDTDQEEVEAVSERILLRSRMLYEMGQMQTYLGSVSSDPVDPEEEDPEEPAPARKRSGPVEQAEPETRERSYRGIIFAAAGLLLLGWLWHSGVGRTTRSSGGRARVQASDFSPRKRGGGPGDEGSRSGAYKGNGETSTSVTASYGDVFVVSGGERRALEDAPIRRGDVLETGEAGRALVDLKSDSSQLELESESELQVGAAEETRGPPKLSLRVGNVWVLAKNPTLELHSPLAVVTAAAGTLFRFRVVLSSATTVNVIRGTTWVQSKVSDEKIIVVGEGKSLRIYPRGAYDVVDIEDRDRPRWILF